MVVDLARMHCAAFAYELQQQLCLFLARRGPPPTASGWNTDSRPRMHQRLQGIRHETVVNEDVFLDAELRVIAFQIPGAVVLHSMAKGKVLSASRRADRVGLHKAQPIDGAFQGGGCEEAAGDGVAPQVVQGNQRTLNLLFDGDGYSIATAPFTGPVF